MAKATTSQRRLPSEKQSTHAALPSEAYVPQTMPPVFRTGDMVTLFLLNVFWVTNITPIAAGGSAGFLYWILCGCTFFIPCSFVMAQLARMFPHEGSILSWTHYALGERWSFFVGLCAWLPGILSVVNAAAAVISWVQAIHSQWLILPWQQGIAMLVVLGLTGWLACQRTRMVQYVLNFAAVLMGLSTVLIVFAAIVWLFTGRHSVTNFADTAGWTITPANFALLGSATLALLGSDMPLVMAGEVNPQKKQSILSHHLTWGTIFTLGGYILFTFAILVVQGANAAANTVNPMVLLISTVGNVFGMGVGNVMALCLGFYFLMIPVALHICFARLLLAAAIDRRISVWFARLNKHRVPINALMAQIAVAIVSALVIYFLIPSISFLGKPADLSSIAYNVLGASLLLVWAVSFMFPFIDIAVLYVKERNLFLQNRILPLPLLVLCVIAGILLCAATIVFTLLNSFIPTLIPNDAWWYVIGGFALVFLFIFIMFSLLTSSQASWEELSELSELSKRQ